MLVVTKKLYRLAVRIEIYNSVSMRFTTLKSPPDDFFVQFCSEMKFIVSNTMRNKCLFIFLLNACGVFNRLNISFFVGLGVQKYLLVESEGLILFL